MRKYVIFTIVLVAFLMSLVLINNVRADCTRCLNQHQGGNCVPDTVRDTDTVLVPVPYDTPDTICQNWSIYQMAEVCTLYSAGTVTGNCENNYHIGLQDTLADTNECHLLIEPSDPMCSRQVEQITEIISATLYIYALYAPAQPTDSIYAYTIDSLWVASEADWEYCRSAVSWGTGGGDGTYLGGSEIMPADSGWIAIDVTTPVSNWYFHTSYGIMLMASEATFFDYVIIQHPSMCGCPTCPYIEVEYVLEGEGEPN